MAITPLPTPPSRDDPTNFAARGDAFLGALPDFATEANVLAEQVNANAITAAADAETAEASANAALAVAGAVVWVSGTTYAIGDAVWSPISLHTYRRKTAGGGVIDPSLDTENWVDLTGGVAGGTISAIASGAISTGSPIVINSNGTVSEVSGSEEVVFSSASTDNVKVAYDPTNSKIVIVYTDAAAADLGKAIVGTVSGTGITYGSPVNFSNGGSAYQPSICFDSVNQKFVIFYRAPSNYGYSVVGTVSGTSISFGTPVVYNSADSWYNNSVYDVGSGKVLVFYNATPGDSGGYGRAGTVSGTTISFGSAYVIFGGSNVRHVNCAYHVAEAKTVIGVCDVNASRNAALFVVSVSGTVLSYGARTSTNRANNTLNTLAYDSVAQQIVYAYTSNNILEVRTASVSGTTSTIVGAATISSGTVYSCGLAYDSSSQKVLISYAESPGVAGKVKTGTNTGAAITFSGESQFNANTSSVASTYDENNSSVIVVYRDDGNLGYGTSLSIVGGSLTNLTSGNYIGFAGASYTNGQTANIQVVGSTNEDQAGLTPGIQYYVNPEGGISASAGIPSVIAGTAIASTKLIIKG